MTLTNIDQFGRSIRCPSFRPRTNPWRGCWSVPGTDFSNVTFAGYARSSVSRRVPKRRPRPAWPAQLHAHVTASGSLLWIGLTASLAAVALTLTGINRYPIKSCRGHGLPQATVEPWGLAGDRRWMLVDDDGRVVTAREYPQLVLVTP
ncbi:MAG: MOSC domain-containing protein, partial [Pseudonocardiaceae bacterium]